MPSITIPADLTLVLRRTLVEKYAHATEDAKAAADAYLLAILDEEADAREAAALLVTKRKAILELEELFEVLGDEDVPDDRQVRLALAELVDYAIEIAAYSTGTDPDRIIATGALLMRLRTLRDELEPEAVIA